MFSIYRHACPTKSPLVETTDFEFIILILKLISNEYSQIVSGEVIARCSGKWLYLNFSNIERYNLKS